LCVRRPGSSLYDIIGTYDMATDDYYFERGINLRHGFLTEYVVDEPEYIIRGTRKFAGSRSSHGTHERRAKSD
jgi:hypothetical protein